ncbi:MAG: histidine--tRNA ligase, partial [Candidatus ainarchaeum sp.]|nr:histidine--tRNA ligase [Candidatus ainarchaeum sp.]
MSNRSTPKGMRDFLPEDMLIREEVIEKIKKVYRKYGYLPLETPAMEYLKVLDSKQSGEEIAGQIFKIENSELGLRYDLTVPLARVASENSFPKPFKRYCIGRVWRREEPQKGRFREFWQADIDVIGSKSMRADAEAITAAREAIIELGFDTPKIIINNRKIMNSLSKKIGFEKEVNFVLRIMDKLDKIGENEVKKQLENKIGKEKTEKILKEIIVKGDNRKKLEIAKKVDEEGAKELEEIIKLCNFEIEIDFSLVRGLGYYTGPVFEIKLGDKIGSVAGGGRYDNLIGLYGQTDYAVGISLGIERLILLIKERSKEKTKTKVLVCAIDEKLYPDVLKIAEKI